MKIHESLENIDPNFIFPATDIKFLFRNIPREELYEVWDLIQPELLKTLKYSPEENICSGDIFYALKTRQNTQLYLVEDFQGEYLGFFVVEIIQKEYSRDCHIWLTGTNKLKVFQEIGKMVFNVARFNKCNKITASSTRDAMGVALRNFGMKPKFVTYEMEI